MINPLNSVSDKKILKDEVHSELFGKPYYYFMEKIKHLHPKSIIMYRSRLADFLDICQSDTEQFYQFILDSKNPDDPRDKGAVKKFLDDFCQFLMVREDNPYKFNTVLTYVYAINHFLNANDQRIDYAYKPSKKMTPEEYTQKVVPNGADRISREKIIQLMSLTTNPQYRSVLMMLKDSGLRASDISQIKYKHIREALSDPEPDFITFEILPIKNMNASGLIANPVIGPDAIKYLKIWLAYKKKKFGERYQYEKNLMKYAATRSNYKYVKVPFEPKEYPYTENDEDYVYCYMETKNTYTNKNGKTVEGRGFSEPLEIEAGSNMVQIMKRNHKAEFKKLSAHSFRKAHTTGLTAAHVPERWQNKMQGKVGKGTQGVYQKPNPEEIIREYSAGYAQISLAEPQAEHITELENKIDTLERIVMKNLLQRENWEALRNPPA